MKSIKGLMAGLAAAGLMLAQPAQAQEANELESALGMPAGSGLLVFIFVLVGLGVAAGLIFEDDSDRPTSP
jgi:hypothetical protein